MTLLSAKYARGKRFLRSWIQVEIPHQLGLPYLGIEEYQDVR